MPFPFLSSPDGADHPAISLPLSGASYALCLKSKSAPSALSEYMRAMRRYALLEQQRVAASYAIILLLIIRRHSPFTSLAFFRPHDSTASHATTHDVSWSPLGGGGHSSLAAVIAVTFFPPLPPLERTKALSSRRRLFVDRRLCHASAAMPATVTADGLHATCRALRQAAGIQKISG